MNRWIIISIVWFIVGVSSYVTILRFFPPTPIIVDREPMAPIRNAGRRWFTVWSPVLTPVSAIWRSVMTPVSLVLLISLSPVILIGIIYVKLRDLKRAR